MAAVTPDTNLTIIKLPIELDSNNQLTFASATAQHTYFDSLTDNLDVENFSYQRKDGVIRYPAHIDTIYNYNYCMYQNENYGNKWFYAFITDMKYVNDNMTEITIVTDAWQTWQFDLTLNKMFVEREIVAKADDTFGKYKIDEGLEIGPTKFVEAIDDQNWFSYLEVYYVIAFTGDTLTNGNTTVTIPKGGLYINNIPSSVPFIICDSLTDFCNTLIWINNDGAGDKIITCFTIPKVSFVDHFANYKMNGSSIGLKVCIISQGAYNTSEKTLKVKHKPTFSINAVDSYTPKNKKLLQYPYMYLGSGSMTSTQKVYKYEDFYDNVGIIVDNTTDNINDLSFIIRCELNPNPTLIFSPVNYKTWGSTSIFDSITINNYPTLAYFNDVFNTWLAENLEMTKLNVEQQTGDLLFGFGRDAFNTLSSTLSQATNENIGGAVTSLIGGGIGIVQRGYDYDMQIRKTLTSIKQQSLVPDAITLGGSSTALGYGLIAHNILNKYEITYEYAKRIDDYFSTYGYTINEMKVPNINSRSNWNYIKTIGANIFGDIPVNDLETIKNLFNNGITFWHTTTHFLDYSQTNS